MKRSIIITLMLIGAYTSTQAQSMPGLYGRSKRKTSLHMPDFKTAVVINEDERFEILNAYKAFFMVEYPPVIYRGQEATRGYILQKDVETFIYYNEKKGGSLQSFEPAIDPAYAEQWNDSTINAWRKIAAHRNYKERRLLFDKEEFESLDSLPKKHD